jgi:hypothetical protein
MKRFGVKPVKLGGRDCLFRVEDVLKLERQCQ